VIAGIGAAALAGYALSDYTAMNNQHFQIQQISNTADGVAITYTPSATITSYDKVELTDTDCSPPINQEWEVKGKYSDNKIGIDIGKKLDHDGASGTLILHTSFESQLLKRMGKLLEGAAGLAAQGFCAFAKSIGIDCDTLKWVLIGLGILVGLMLLYWIYSTLFATKPAKQ
jgi:hypothetical protein